jgi:hypothetical protein
LATDEPVGVVAARLAFEVMPDVEPWRRWVVLTGE